MKINLRLLNKIKQVYYIFLIIMTIPLALAMDYTESILSTPAEHLEFIRSSLNSAKNRIIIVSPFISSWVIDDSQYNAHDGLRDYLRNAIERNVEVCVFTDVVIKKNEGVNKRM